MSQNFVLISNMHSPDKIRICGDHSGNSGGSFSRRPCGPLCSPSAAGPWGSSASSGLRTLFADPPTRARQGRGDAQRSGPRAPAPSHMLRTSGEGLTQIWRGSGTTPTKHDIKRGVFFFSNRAPLWHAPIWKSTPPPGIDFRETSWTTTPPREGGRQSPRIRAGLREAAKGALERTGSGAPAPRVRPEAVLCPGHLPPRGCRRELPGLGASRPLEHTLAASRSLAGCCGFGVQALGLRAMEI